MSIFEGFEVPNTTPVPDIVFDELLEKLTGNELKVLLYIIRRTYGFGKNADAISLSQFREGITTREGKVLDKGCGIKHNRTILVALRSLEKQGYIVSIKRTSKERDADTTIYKLHFKKSSENSPQAKPKKGVVTSSNHRSLPQVTTGGYSKSRPVVTSGNRQETVLQETGKQETDNKREDNANNNSSQNRSTKPTPPAPNNFLNEKIEQFRSAFIALGKEYFAYDKFTAGRVQPTSEVATRILEIIGDGETNPQAMRRAFLKLWNHKDKDGTYWWRDKSKLTLKAYVNNYDDQDTKQPVNDLTTPSDDPFSYESLTARYNTKRTRKHREGFITTGPGECD